MRTPCQILNTLVPTEILDLCIYSCYVIEYFNIQLHVKANDTLVIGHCNEYYERLTRMDFTSEIKLLIEWKRILIYKQSPLDLHRHNNPDTNDNFL